MSNNTINLNPLFDELDKIEDDITKELNSEIKVLFSTIKKKIKTRILNTNRAIQIKRFTIKHSKQGDTKNESAMKKKGGNFTVRSKEK